MSILQSVCRSDETAELDVATFEKLRVLIYDKCGITLRPSKRTMLGSRIQKRLRTLKLNSFSRYLDYLVNEAGEEEWVQLINVVSTNVTSFYREPHHFEQLSTDVQKWAKDGVKKMRFWSAASSSGQEPYTMAMTICKALAKSGCQSVNAKILATDISTQMLAVCKVGQYKLESLSTIPQEERRKYFKLDPSTGLYQVSSTLRQMICFARLNLAEPPFVMKGPLDAVFCRNVMIYFDNKIRTQIVNQVVRLLKPGGLFMIGHAESLQGSQTDHFERIGASMYRKTS